MTVTLVTLLKRRAGMSKAEFIAYYEEHHRRIGERVLAGYATRYVRRFLFPEDGTDNVHDPDVVMEIDFPDRETLDAFFRMAGESAVATMIAEDEERLFDRSRNRSFTVEERRSALPPLTR
jgi:hypothetical protein